MKQNVLQKTESSISHNNAPFHNIKKKLTSPSTTFSPHKGNTRDL